MPNTDKSVKTLQKGPKLSEVRQAFRLHGVNAWSHLQAQHGDHFLFQGIWVCSDPEWVEKLLMQKVHTRERSKLYKKSQSLIPLANGMLFMDGEDWQKRLQAVMPAFTKQEVEEYATTMLDHLELSWAVWGEGVCEDVYAHIIELNKKHLFHAGYGLDLQNEAVETLANRLIEYKFMRMDQRHRVDFFGIGRKELGALARTLMHVPKLKRLEKQIQQDISALQKENLEPAKGKGIDWYWRLKNAAFSDTDIARELNHLYSAYNALDYVLTCAMIELAKEPKWQEEIRNEWKSMTQDGFTFERYKTMKSLSNFCKEVLRYYPVTMGVSRRTGEEIQLGKDKIKAGQEVLILLYPLHFHPDYWDKPEEFNPNRWEQGPKHPAAYVPFLKGSRHCIGRHLAELNMALVVGSALAKFSLSLHTDIPPLNQFMMPRFDYPVSLTFTSLS